MTRRWWVVLWDGSTLGPFTNKRKADSHAATNHNSRVTMRPPANA